MGRTFQEFVVLMCGVMCGAAFMMIALAVSGTAPIAFQF